MAGKVEGKLSGKAPSPTTPVAFFLAGWPDDHSCWEQVAPSLHKTHTVAVACFPDYDIKAPAYGAGKLRRWFGYDLTEVCDMVAEAIKEVAPGKQVLYIGHDWGAYMAYLLAAKYPELFSKMVTLDVGIVTPEGSTIGNILIIMLYQLWNTMAFVLSQLIHTLAGDICLATYPWKTIGPCPFDIGKMPRRTKEVHSWMCYPYFYLWTRMLTLRAPKMSFPPKKGIPLLFCYGAKKRAMFHTRTFLDKIDADGASKHVCFEDCGHWLQTQNPQKVIDEIQGFLAK
eukprot:CAMPEP_0118967030 /NCGR_PEP_ID=MMETSP1173-20130426/4444_1 /TAXON_ID=1034831 /ORGANISM="Rhizochromulina marina cf, Strain CCMP1243" /LENGTH=283 /DNA_ID=CAMNT_0006915921 /DNA_START=27 /DNA_END=878 /DNA_ORIENTATION=+